MIQLYYNREAVSLLALDQQITQDHPSLELRLLDDSNSRLKKGTAEQTRLLSDQ